jgi:2-succinyl-6-hydroxy-2,4-cyclohexadiene-1-carboxylate synthase
MLLHGFTGAPASWEPVLAAGNFAGRALTPFLAGHGAEWRSISVETFGDEIERLAELAKTMDEPRLVAGYSLGARVALVLLERHPGLFAGAVLVGARPGLVDSSEREKRRAADVERAAMLRAEGMERFVESWEAQPLFETQSQLPRSTLAAQRAVRESHDAEGLAHSLEVLGLASMPPTALPFQSVRVTLMTGALDVKFTEIAEQVAARHPKVSLVTVPMAGHNLLLEAPHEVAHEMMRVESDVCAGEGG